MKLARGTAPAHVITYNPTTAHPDYAICCQCGGILRIWAIPEGQRFDVATTYWGRKETEKLVTEQLRLAGMSPSKAMRLQVTDQVYNGLIRQLRSVPLGLRIDTWLSRECPGLAEQQRAMIARQLQDNLAVFGSEIRKLAPPKVYEANMAMNAAFAAYWSRLWSDPTLISPYTISGHLPAGQALLKILDETPDDPLHDRELIDGWGRSLGLETWFQFVPFQQN
jgi:hypothetical protein